MPVLLLLFIALPIAELWLLLKIGAHVGAPLTLGLVFGTGILGSILARRAGSKAMSEFLRLSNSGVLPGQAIFDGFAIFVGGALLMTPGIITDIVGFFLLLRPTRAFIQLAVMRYVQVRAQGSTVFTQETMGSPRPENGEETVIDQQFSPGDVRDKPKHK